MHVPNCDEGLQNHEQQQLCRDCSTSNLKYMWGYVGMSMDQACAWGNLHAEKGLLN